MFDKLLLAYDGTPASDRAFEQAVALARRNGSVLHVVAVAWSAEAETRVLLDKARAQCAECLRGLRARSEAAGVDVETEVVEGLPSEQIVAAADRLGADLVVIGHRRRTWLGRLAEASVAKRVIDRAHCCVMVAG